MRGDLGKHGGVKWGVCVLWLSSLVLAGCSTATGLIGISPPRHTMLESTKTLRVSGTGVQPLPRELNKSVLPSYVVEPGDVLLVTTADLDSPVRLPGDQPVLPDGTINLGRYGRIIVAGKTAEQIEEMVHATVEAQAKDTKVGPISVRIVTRVSKIYYVLGEVNAPGSFQLTGRETVLDGLVAAGGLTDRASRENIVLARPTQPDSCRKVLPICYQQIVQLGDTTTNYQLTPGDRIFVASKTVCEQLSVTRRESDLCHCPQVPCFSPAGCPSGGCDAGAGEVAPGESTPAFHSAWMPAHTYVAPEGWLPTRSNGPVLPGGTEKGPTAPLPVGQVMPVSQGTDGVERQGE
jgi:polysaccharide biosynthesis/export protein